MKKIIILVITTILLTGCNATYDINFTKESIQDTIKIYTESSKVSNAYGDTITDFEEKLGNWERGYEYYKRELYTEDDITGYKYTYDFHYDEYDAMSQLRKCYKDFEFTNSVEYINLSTSNEFLCQTYYKDVNSITITIESEYKIEESNADTKSNNTHIWKIDKNNYQNKPINFKINKNQKYIEKKENETIKIKPIIITSLFIILILILIIRKKEQKNHK